MNFSEELKKAKFNSCSDRSGIELGEPFIADAITGFCKREDIIGVPQKVVYELFDKYCRENNLPLINKNVAGMMFKKCFNIDRKKVRRKNKTFYVFSEPKAVEKLGKAYCGIEIGEDTICNVLDKFHDENDICYIVHNVLFELFDEYCIKNNFPLINHITLGRVITQHFNVVRKKVRKGNSLFWIYVPNQIIDKE